MLAAKSVYLPNPLLFPPHISSSSTRLPVSFISASSSFLTMLKVDVSRTKLIYVIFEFVLLRITIIYLTKHRYIHVRNFVRKKPPYAVDCVFYIRVFRGACECTWKYWSISSNSPTQLQIKDTINECLWLIVEVLWMVYWWLEEDKRFLCVGCSVMWAILPIREWRCQDIDQVVRHQIFFFSVYSAAVKC